MTTDPLQKSKDDYTEIIQRISATDSPVGIDATLTHAMIIDYLRQISDRLMEIEHRLAGEQSPAQKTQMPSNR